MRYRVLGAQLAAGLLATVGLAGCSSVVKEQRTTTIDSDPPGATVLASGVEIGATPLTVRPDEVFPPHFVGFEYRSSGTLTVKKPGCKTFSEQVNDAVLSRDIHVKLDCDPNYRPSPAVRAPAPPAASAPTSPAARPDASIAARLQRLDALRKQGLITADEYRQIRKKILDAL